MFGSFQFGSPQFAGAYTVSVTAHGHSYPIARQVSVGYRGTKWKRVSDWEEILIVRDFTSEVRYTKPVIYRALDVFSTKETPPVREPQHTQVTMRNLHSGLTTQAGNTFISIVHAPVCPTEQETMNILSAMPATVAAVSAERTSISITTDPDASYSTSHVQDAHAQSDVTIAAIRTNFLIRDLIDQEERDIMNSSRWH